MAQVLVEQDCTVTLDGQSFTAGGAFVSPTHARGYLAEQRGIDMHSRAPIKRLVVTDWHGNVLGGARIVSTWKTPNSYVSDRMHQVEASIDGTTYTGRSAGVGMVWSGKATKHQ